MRYLIILFMLFLLGCDGIGDTPKGHYEYTIQLTTGPVTYESFYPIKAFTYGSHGVVYIESEFYENGTRYTQTFARYSLYNVVSY